MESLTNDRRSNSSNDIVFEITTWISIDMSIHRTLWYINAMLIATNYLNVTNLFPSLKYFLLIYFTLLRLSSSK